MFEPSPKEVAHPEKGAEFGHGGRAVPFANSSYLIGVHGEKAVTHDAANVFHVGAKEIALFSIAEIHLVRQGGAHSMKVVEMSLLGLAINHQIVDVGMDAWGVIDKRYGLGSRDA